MKAARRVLSRLAERAVGGTRLRDMAFRQLSQSGALVYRDLGDHQLVFDPAETIGRRLWNHGNFQRAQTELVFRTVTEGAPRGALLEIGANIGTQTLYAHMSGLFDRILAVEPDPMNLGVLRANLRLNGAEAVEVHPIGLSRAAGTAQLTRNPYNSGASTVERTRDAQAMPGAGAAVEVPLDTGDALLARAGLAPEDVALVWMDVERHEAAVIEGLAGLLAARRPVYFEYAFEQPDAAAAEQVDRLVLSAYPHLYVDTDRLRPAHRADILSGAVAEGGRHVNVLAIDRPLS